MTRQPSSASRRWEDPSGIRTTTNMSGHLQQTLQLGRGGCVLETQRFVRMHITMSGLRHERCLMKAGEDELELAGIGVDVADGENALGADLEFLCVDRDQVLVEIEAEIGDRPELHGEAEEGKQRVGGNLSGRAVHALDREQPVGQLLAGADRKTRDVVDWLLGIELGALAARLVENIDDIRLQPREPELENSKEPDRTRANNNDIGASAVYRHRLLVPP